jgi:inorganic triphosphatase YgiF
VGAGQDVEISRERELKLALDPADAERLRAEPALIAAARKRETLISTYFDTPDFALRRAGLYLRVRDRGASFVQTVKRESGSLLERGEWETPLPGREPDLDAASGTPLGPLLTPDLRRALRPQFETRIRRETHDLVQGGAEIEVAIDEGEILARARHEPISEVELELKRGDPRALFALARKLSESVPLRLAVKTKAERGFELAEDRAAGAEKAAEMQVLPDMPCGEAFRAVARSCLRQILVNVPGAGEGQPESLHQMRVGLRRLRAAIALFADAVAGSGIAGLKGELKWVTRALGPARDLDVFASGALATLARDHPDDAAAAEQRFAAKRAAAYDEVRAALQSRRFRRLLLDLAEAIECGDFTASEAALPVAEHARHELARLRRRIRRKGAGLKSLGVRGRHRLRIRTKRLRYATEFFAATFPGAIAAKRRADFLSALKDLQDALGGLNDLAAHDAMLREGEGSPVLHQHHRNRAHAEEAKLLAAAEQAFARFDRAKAFWKARAAASASSGKVGTGFPKR